ncbi:MAG: proline dehydrogenase family protein [Armatimonadota bacterium]|nr:proline dehydrogenase family protein [bacterium]MCS7310398.1 proline dehydrogenase family protein [Armatimonadota bacterium]MDW8289827.1 proline dehydrogenase family protein [Armatimonadota bacterium]
MFSRAIVLKVAALPPVRRLITQGRLFRKLVDRFVAGETLQDALRVAQQLQAKGLKVSIDYLGESVRDRQTAQAVVEEYLRAIPQLAEAGLDTQVSVKLTQLGLDIEQEYCLRNLECIVRRAQEVGGFVRIDMEGSAYTQRTLDIFAALHERYPNLGVVIQAYLYRSDEDVERLIRCRASVRLCKGAYAEPASIAYPKRSQVNAAYRRLMQRLLLDGYAPALATHDESIIRDAIAFVRSHQIPPQRFEFEMLYGIRRDLQERLVSQGYQMRVYVPYGEAWYPYFTRRLAERPANLLFFLRHLLR